MKLHRNARLTPLGRQLLVERVCRQHVPLNHAAQDAGVSTRTASKWVARYRSEGIAGLEDRSSAPRHVPGRTSDERVTAIAALRRLRMTAAEISELLGMPVSTVSVVLGGSGSASAAAWSRSSRRTATSEGVRASWSTSTSRSSGGSRGVGHRITGKRASQAKRAAGTRRSTSAGSASTSASTTPPAWPTSRCSATRRPRPRRLPAPRSRLLRRHGIHVERVMTDNGAAYRSIVHALACRALGTPPHPHPALPATHQRQGRALHPHDARRLGLRRDLRPSAERTRALPGWLDHYNRRRPHRSLNRQPPLTRLQQMRNNAPGSYS